VEVSVAGRAPRNDPALFALAAAASLGATAEAHSYALSVLGLVARTSTHLFHFLTYVEQFRGWGRGLRRGVAGWYLGRPVEDLAYQAVKYRQRDGWTHRDALRLAHPKTGEPARADLFRWITQGGDTDIPVIAAYLQAQATTDVRTWVRLIRDHRLTWEMLPDAALKEPAVWEAMIANRMPQTALMRQLPRLTNLGVLDRKETRDVVATQLADPVALRNAQIHPVNVLVAQRTYASGQSVRGSGEWTPKRQIVDALDAAFYASFAAVVPTGKRTLLALDVSGSMTAPAGGRPVSCREVSAALALVTMAVESDVKVVGFTSGPSHRWGSAALTELSISPRQRLDDVVRTVGGLDFGATDCALPMIWAGQRGEVYDTIVIYTDSETWWGGVHPHQALVEYRRRVGFDTRLVVVGLTATQLSIADPLDRGSLDVAGFDSAVPNLIADFSRGDI
jgi:60 kDa SS-A/Ro ribonucleoprotein